ncbi:unnamed protein product [Heligmosomoides polygyrus]|uniref:Uncharacterized protein n=1 Tax=Heligmosomoides polygyrus TaxID=6339 RepID=A0A183F293_HELPZ|nr:unnamed protein product [Heligmosomoides polygyrus]
MKGLGPFSPVLTINPDPTGQFLCWFCLCCTFVFKRLLFALSC